jgi:hypothetical protein
MIRYLARSCPRCNGYVGITTREPGRNIAVQAVNGRCTRCSYQMAWIVIKGKSHIDPQDPEGKSYRSRELKN